MNSRIASCDGSFPNMYHCEFQLGKSDHIGAPTACTNINPGGQGQGREGRISRDASARRPDPPFELSEKILLNVTNGVS